MILAEMTWPEVDALDRERTVVLIPTGSLEQHGAHLPLFTDSLLVSAVATAVEARAADRVLLTPTLWLGASGHHLKFSGTLSASMSSYIQSLQAVVKSLAPHGFRKFFVVNGHGGNTELNGVALRELKEASPNLMLGHAGYFAPVAGMVGEIMEGRYREMRHACEAETSLMLHLHPSLVRVDRRRNDGLTPDPAVYGMIHLFDEMTEAGSLGDAPLGTAEKGAAIFEAAVSAFVGNLVVLSDGYRLVEP